MGGKRGQLSAEMLILIVVVLAVVAIVAAQLIQTAQTGGEEIEEETGEIFEKMETATKGKAGDLCLEDSDCLSEDCDEQQKVCR